MRYHTALPVLAAAALAACRDSAPTGPRVAEPLAMRSGATTLAAVTPTTVSATSCATIQGASASWRELKAPATSGTYTDGNITVTLTMNGRYFGWSATSTKTAGIDAVLAKAAPSAALYRYDPPAERTSDVGLSGPINKTRPSSPPAQVKAVFFCYDLEASVSGTVFEDMDADGAARESDLAYPPDSVGEPGVWWQTVYVDYDGDGVLDAAEPSAVSGEGGAYTIPFVAPGTWRVRLVRRWNSPWTCSYPSSCSVQRTLTAGAASTGNDFGIWDTSYLDGVVRNELTGEGLYGWTVYADYNDNGTLDVGEPSTLTATNGRFLLTRIRPGTRTIREVLFPGWACRAPDPCAIEKSFYSARGHGDAAFVNSSFQDFQ